MVGARRLSSFTDVIGAAGGVGVVPDPNMLVAPPPSSGMAVRWLVLVAAPVAADLGSSLPGTSQDAAARAREMEFLRTDMGENLLWATAKAGGGGVVCVVPFLKASPWRSSRPLFATSGGNPRSVDQMTTTLWCRFPLGGVIHGGTHGLEGTEDIFFDGAVLHLIH